MTAQVHDEATTSPAGSASPAVRPATRDLTDAPTGPPPGYLTAEMVAELLARATDKKSVPASTIRSMASRGRMPAAAPVRWGRRILWDEAAITDWISDRESRHVPRTVVRQLQRRLTHLDEQARATGNDARLKQGVRDAYRRGLSFQQIADAIKVKNGDHHPTREAVRSRFGPYL